MIQRAFITAWRPRAPWPTDAQVEQDLVLSRSILEIYSDLHIASALAFRGGTALHKLFFSQPGRYSEDLDFVQVTAGPIGPIINGLRARLDTWLGKPQWKLGHGRATLTYRFQSEVPPIAPLRMKVEINTREHFTVLGLLEKPFVLDSPWYAGSAAVQTYTLEEILATKLRALYQRKKGRDLFDLWLALKHLPVIDPSKVVACFTRYMEHVKSRASRAEFEANLAAKLNDSAFTNDIPPLLPSGGPGFNAVDALEQVQSAFISLIPGEPWKHTR